MERGSTNHEVISPWVSPMCVDILIFASSFYVLLICVVSHDCSGLSLAVGFLCYLDFPSQRTDPFSGLATGAPQLRAYHSDTHQEAELN